MAVVTLNVSQVLQPAKQNITRVKDKF